MSGAYLQWLYAFGLLLLGFVLVLLEIFVIPGLNIFGIAGFFCVCGGVYFAYIKLGTGPAIAVAIAGLAGTIFLIWVLVRRRAWQRLVLDSKTTRDQGYDSSQPGLGDLVGQRGEALTPLRRAGRARFGEQLADVVSEGDFLASGEVVEVLAVEGNRVVVQKIEEADS